MFFHFLKGFILCYLIHSQIEKEVKRFLIHVLFWHMHTLPYQHFSLEWYISYTWWNYICILLSVKIYTLWYSMSLYKYIMTCIYHYTSDSKCSVLHVFILVTPPQKKPYKSVENKREYGQTAVLFLLPFKIMWCINVFFSFCFICTFECF